MNGQAQDVPPPPPGAIDSFVLAMQNLGWIDITALSVLLVFFVVGLFKGVVWQVSRVVILIAAYVLAGQLGPALGEVLLGWTHVGPEPPTLDQRDTSFYIACVLIFLGVLVLLSLLALLVQKLINKAGLGFYDRLFGGVFGVGSGAVVVLFLMTVLYMFFPKSPVAAAAEESHSLRLSRQAVRALGLTVPQELSRVFPPEGMDGVPVEGHDGTGQGGPGQGGPGQGAPGQGAAPLPIEAGGDGDGQAVPGDARKGDGQASPAPKEPQPAEQPKKSGDASAAPGGERRGG